jgi:hypothetical protein
MPLPKIRGISAALQLALIELMDDLCDEELDTDVARRAQWFKQGLQGHRPEAGLLYVDDAGPLVPALGAGELVKA